jgi:L,D-peptidoglycan transpeptidase YkuD (ErfK/YbiS/YcfS/YnhG family)
MKTKNDHPQSSPELVVRSLAPGSSRGFVEFGSLRLPCALGRSGRTSAKREGDGATPIGSFPLREAFYRADRLRRPRTALPIRAIRPADGWCDEPNDRNYNRFVRHPYPGSAERLWRSDHLYDLVLVMGYNDGPRVAGRGSAIFMHVAGEDFSPTAGCVALRLPDLIRLLESVRPATKVRILA